MRVVRANIPLIKYPTLETHETASELTGCTANRNAVIKATRLSNIMYIKINTNQVITTCSVNETVCITNVL